MRNIFDWSSFLGWQVRSFDTVIKVTKDISIKWSSNWAGSSNMKKKIDEFLKGFYIKLSSAVAAILVWGWKWRTQFWEKTIIQGLFQQSLIKIRLVVSDQMMFIKNSHFFLFLPWQPYCLKFWVMRQNFSKEPSNDHSSQVWSRYWLSTFREGFLKFHPPFFLFLILRPFCAEVGINGHNFSKGPSNDHSSQV